MTVDAPPGPQPGYPPQQPGYPPQQPGYAPQQPGYPPQQAGYPPQQPGYPPQQPGYPPQQGFPPPQGFPPAQGTGATAAPVAGIPVGQPAMTAGAPTVVVAGGGGNNMWKHGICDCCENPAFCCLSFWCECIAFGQLKERQGEECYGNGCAYCGLICLGEFIGIPCLQHCLGCSNRAQLRTHYQIPGDQFSDWCCHWCCTSCVLTQEMDHVTAYPYQRQQTTVVVMQ
eukprot:CAMPEP_0116998794 /NCGR_PEP_ID=MMETSP0472-20121206/1743_1 /TAXON_ID=693140 ORGANISM="Tiarina fusus, Strain LIS" /NCGR_SAMPLE_ID=MMETSP0472 /ASSEMBLY_ACC=CAM_ASM_000603 /LENGTH=226 /DNA_ID=CAMNT_0004698057 /DNA_START=10 /DNA_END=690 /DNA_ORIENTATION=-